MSQTLKRLNALDPRTRRFLYLPSDLVTSPKNEVETFLNDFSKSHTPIGKGYDTEAWTVILDASPNRMKEIKQFLLQNGIYYVDGYEDVEFNIQYFDSMPVFDKNMRKSTNIEKASHHIRLLSSSTFNENIDKFREKQRRPHSYIHVSGPNTDNGKFHPAIGTKVFQLPRPSSCLELSFLW